MLSIVTIYREEDEHLLWDMINSIPKYANLVLVKTVPGEKDYEFSEVVKDGEATMATLEYSGNFDFSKARNKAQTLADRDWIFHLDSDDRLIPSQFEQMRLVLEQTPEDVFALIVNVMNYALLLTDPPKHEWRNDLQLKLIRNKNIQWEGILHETVELEIYRQDKKIVLSPILVHHVGYENKEVLENKLLRNVKGMMSDELTLQHKRFANLLIRDLTILHKLKEIDNGK
jgi:glycosyltransferase involved in cell wall biosynthesis